MSVIGHAKLENTDDLLFVYSPAKLPEHTKTYKIENYNNIQISKSSLTNNSVDSVIREYNINKSFNMVSESVDLVNGRNGIPNGATIPVYHVLNSSEFVINGVTMCGFFKVKEFPIINTVSKFGGSPASYQKSMLGICQLTCESLPYGTRIGVRKSNESNKFSIGIQHNSSVIYVHSIMTEYQYDIGIWYFYCFKIKLNSTLDSWECKLSIDGEDINTYYNPNLRFTWRSYAYGAAGKQYYSTKFNNIRLAYPISENLINYNGNTLTGEISTIHTIYPPIGKTIRLSNNTYNFQFIYTVNPFLFKFHHCVYNIHESIDIGCHYVYKTYDINENNIYKNFKSIYL
jgi:hypothetical protein